MEIYVLTVLVIIAIGLSSAINSKLNQITILFSCFLLVIISGFRTLDVGTDTSTYNFLFEMTGQMSLREVFSHFYEIFYTISCWILYQLGGDYYSLMLLESILLMGSIYYFIRRDSEIPWLSIVLFMAFGYFHQSMNISRQFIAIAISLIGFHFLLHHKTKLFLIYGVAAVCFHISALITFGFYPLVKISFKKKEFLLIAVAAMVFVFKGYLLTIIMGLLPFNYQSLDLQSEGFNILALWFLLLCITSTMSFFSGGNIWELESKLVCVAFTFQCFIGEVPVIGRLAYYFIIPFYLLLPNVIYTFKGRVIKILLTAIATTSVLIYYFLLYLPYGASNTVPYFSRLWD